jgi:hypothetical protein
MSDGKAKRACAKHALGGSALGVLGSLPAGDAVVTLYLSALFAAGAGITGFMFEQVQNARR